MTTRAVPLGIRLFLEGVEVPVISAQVTIQPDGPAVAAIQVVPADTALNLLPRTLVHLFYLDHLAFDEYGAEVSGVDNEISGIEADLNRFVAPDKYYKLMFAGQVVGYNYSKTPVSRELVLQCMDLSIYWDTCYQWFADYSADGTALTDKSHNFVGAGQGLFDNVASGTKWVIGNILNSAPRSPEYRDTKGLLGGLIHLLETVGGVRRRKGSGTVDWEGYNGVNDFFTIGELRFNLLGMIGAVQKDRTSTKLYNVGAFFDWMRNGMTSTGSLISFRDILTQINNYIFHNIYPNPCARFIEPTNQEAYATVTVQAATFQQTSAGTAILNGIVDLIDALGITAGLLQESAEGTVTHNTETDSWSSKEAERASEGRFALQHVYIRMIPPLKDWAEQLKTDDAKNVQTTLLEVEGHALVGLNAFLGSVSRASDTGHPLITVTSTQSEGDIAKMSRKALDEVSAALDKLSGLTGKKKGGQKKVKKKITITGGAHLFTQLILPETFFVSPPRCNVIFPDEYYQFNYSRNFMREVTRLSLRGGMGLIGGGGGNSANILGRHYFAPKIEDSEGKNLLITMGYGGRIVLPHEIHSGIVPKFEHVSQGHRWGIKAAGANKRLEKVGYLQRLANFNFFLHRWSSRTMQVSGIFMPRLVAGFPAVVIDRAVPPPHVLEAVKSVMVRPMLPTQYLGKIVSLAHSVNQGGGSTSVGFSHCRTHRAYDDEFLGLLVKEEKAYRRSWTVKIEPDILETVPARTRAGYVRILNYYLNPKHKSAKSTSLPPKLEKGEYIKEFGAKVDSFFVKGEYRMDETRAWLLGINLARSQSGTADAPSFGGIQPEASTATALGAPGADGKAVTTTRSTPLNPELQMRPAEVSAEVGAKRGPSRVIVLPKLLEVTLDGGKVDARTSEVAPEDLMIPSWYSNVWRRADPDNKIPGIGVDVYQPLLGTWAITDGVDINAKSQNEVLQLWKSDIAKSAPSGKTDIASVEMDNDQELTVGELVTGSVEAAIDSLGILYGMIQSKGGNIHEFIDRYTYRPIANMIEVMGSETLEFDNMGLVADPETMVEGFHSRSFGPYNVDGGKDAMKALFPGLSTERIRGHGRPALINSRNITKVKPDLDPRGAAQKRVLAYRAELQITRTPS